METLNHLFASGSVVVDVWESFARSLGIKTTNVSTRGICPSWWLTKMEDSILSWLLQVTASLILWNIWMVRNRAKFDGIHMDVSVIRCAVV